MRTMAAANQRTRRGSRATLQSRRDAGKEGAKLNEPKLLQYIEIQREQPVAKAETVPILEIYEITDDPKEASLYVVGKGWAKFIRRDIVRC